MNNVSILLLVLLFLGCKKDKKDPEPSPIIKEIVGKWRLVATEHVENGKTIREEATTARYLIFRFDGLIIDKDGLPVCCTSRFLVVNGQPFKIEPRALVPTNEFCALSLCAFCEDSRLELLQDGDRLITRPSCSSNISDYH